MNKKTLLTIAMLALAVSACQETGHPYSVSENPPPVRGVGDVVCVEQAAYKQYTGGFGIVYNDFSRPVWRVVKVTVDCAKPVLSVVTPNTLACSAMIDDRGAIRGPISSEVVSGATVVDCSKFGTERRRH